jgi:hypothetical protein
MVTTIGLSSSREGREGRSILTLKRNDPTPTISAQVATNEPPAHSTISPLDQFEIALCEARNLWSIRQHQRGFFAGRKLDKRDAERALAAGIAALGSSGWGDVR